MVSAVERELKFEIDDAFELPELDGDPLAPRTFTSTYHDTDDRRLTRLGLTLRRRVENGRGLWQLKLPAEDGRQETEAPGGPARPPKEIADLLFAVLHGRTLGPAARLRTKRDGVRVNGSAGAVEVVIDDVAILDARRVVGRFRELEAEVIEGDARALNPLRKPLTKAGAKPSGLDPKVFRVLGHGMEIPRPRLDGDAEVLRAALGEQVRELLRNDPGTRLGVDPEALHDMRVAIRRLRAFLKLAQPALEPGWSDDLRGRLRWLGNELGPARDFDVLADRLRADGEALGPEDSRAMRRLLAQVEARRAEARSAMVAALRSDPYLELLTDLERAVAAPRFVGEVDLERWAANAFAKLRTRARSIDSDSPDEELHDVRKSAKQARYAAELAEPIAGKRAGKFVREAKRFQDVVGDHQDAAVAETELRGLAAGRSGAITLVIGQLIERSRERRQDARDGFPKAWSRLAKVGKASWS